MSTEVSLVDVKNKQEIKSSFFKNEVTVTGKLETHLDKVYTIKVGETTVILKDEMVDRVDPTEDEKTYKFYLITEAAKGLDYWQMALGEEAGKVLVVETNKYNMPKLSEDLVLLVKENLSKFGDDPAKAKAYVPLSFMMTAEVMASIMGETVSMLCTQTPLMLAFIACWEHGYLANSAIKKQGVKVSTELTPISDEEIARRKRNVDEFGEKLKEGFKKFVDSEENPFKIPDEGDSDSSKTDDEED